MSDIKISQDKNGTFFAYDGQTLIATGDQETVTQYVDAYETKQKINNNGSASQKKKILVPAWVWKNVPAALGVLATLAAVIAAAIINFNANARDQYLAPLDQAVATQWPSPLDTVVPPSTEIVPTPTAMPTIAPLPTITAVPASNIAVTTAQCEAAAAALGWAFDPTSPAGCTLIPASGQSVYLGQWAAGSPAYVYEPAPLPAAADPAPVSLPITGDTSTAPMTGEECAAAGAARGWSATWSQASDGCWLISPDGSTSLHAGTWGE